VTEKAAIANEGRYIAFYVKFAGREGEEYALGIVCHLWNVLLVNSLR
jgi:hypothetical protein